MMTYALGRFALYGAIIFAWFGTASAQSITAANTSKYLGNDQWQWTVYVKAPQDVITQIRSVEYRLHPTFPNPVQRVDRIGDSRYPFALTATGWGVFEIPIRIALKKEQVLTIKHMLQFEAAKNPFCQPEISVRQRQYQLLLGQSLKHKVYVYVGDMYAVRQQKPFQVTVFIDDPSHWAPAGKLTADQFNQRMKAVPEGRQWSAKLRQPGESIQFLVVGQPYVLSVKKVNYSYGSGDSLTLQACEQK